MFTHTFEIHTDGIMIEGEITFNHGEPAHFKTNSGEEMTVAQHGKVQRLLEQLTSFYAVCGDIERLEVVKK